MPSSSPALTPAVEALASTEGSLDEFDAVVTWQFRAVFATLSVLTAMIGVDATAFSVALPVC